jgi:hypothetical protein
MPANLAEIEFLADLPLYQTEKPYLCLLSPERGIDPDQVRLDNLEFEKHSNIKVEDIREHPELQLDDCGFEYLQHQSAISEFTDPADVEVYKQETEGLLRDRFAAVKVLTYELRLRKNQEFRRKQFDLNEKLLLEGPAKGAHNGKRLLRQARIAADNRRCHLRFRPENHSTISLLGRPKNLSEARLSGQNCQVSTGRGVA